MLDLLQPFTEGLVERDASSSTATAWNDSKQEVVEEQHIDEKLPSVATDAGRDSLAQNTKSKKDIIGSQPRGTHNVFTHYPKDSNCEVCQKTTRASCRMKPKKRVDGIGPSADHKILVVENEPRCRHKTAPNGQMISRIGCSVIR